MNRYHRSTRPTIGVLAGWKVFTGTPDSFLERVFRGIQAAAFDRGCNLLLACGIDPGQPAWPLLSPEVAFVPVGPWNTDGLIIVSPFASDAGVQYAQDLVASGFPTVYAGDRDAGPAVVADNPGGIRQALEHLVQHGHRQIAFVAGRRQSEHGDSGVRLRAFQAELHRLGLTFNPDLVAYGGHHYDGGKQAIHSIISQGAKFTAVLASNDRSAIGAMDGLRQAGYVIPQDIAIIGFDDRLEARSQIPSLTTVHYPMFGLGYQAVELLLRAIAGEQVSDELVRIPTRLVIRETCGCMPGLPAKWIEMRGKLAKPQHNDRLQVEQQLTQILISAVHNESLWLNQQEVAYLVQRIIEALYNSLEQNDPLTFYLTFQQILERVAARGDDLFAWQAAVTILRDWVPYILPTTITQLTQPQLEELFHQVRVAISEAARGRSTSLLLDQVNQADQVGLITSKFFTAQDEQEIFSILCNNLPALGIRHATIAYYQAEPDDPVSMCVLQTPDVEHSLTSSSEPREISDTNIRLPSREFPPPGLYSDESPFQLAVLPLHIQNELCGFVAFEAGNLDPCGDIVRQLGAALRGVRLYQEAVEARQQAEEGKRLAEGANRLKSRFLSMVSHELRTPLNLITGISNMLLDEYKPAGFQNNIQEDLKRIYISAQHLDGLIRDVLDLASSDVGQLKLVCEPLEIIDVLEPVAVIGEQLAHEKGLTWHADISQNLPHVWGDRTRLRQVTLNLVSNAIKFTSLGEVRLTALVEDSRLKISVCDTGLGIPVNEQGVIFDEFRQSERTTARGFGGLGLGLAICRKLVEMHGGEITVSSSGKEGEGSLFSFSLPVIENPNFSTDETVSFSGARRVLLLIKDAKGSKTLRDDLVCRGYEVEICFMEQNTNWFSELLLAAPEVVVLDLGLTSERGWEILKIMKENPLTKDIPVLFCALTEETDLGSLLEIDYLTKPVGKAALAEMLLSKGFSTETAGAEASQPVNTPHPANMLDPADRDGTILVVDDEPGILELHARIVESQLPTHPVLQAKNGREALQIIRREHPALVLLDLMMPELDGFAVLEEMRKSDQTRNIPVVVITGQVLTEEDLVRLNAGAASILGKGMFSVAETLEHLAAALEHKRRPGSEAQRIALKAMTYIHAYYAEPITRKDMADYVGLSERHLTRCFHQEVGMTPITYLNRYRVKQAKNLLDSGERGITKIAVEVGFSSSSYFTRVFREEVGLSPRAYLQSRGAPGNS